MWARGFTLVELLVVIFIMGVLASLVSLSISAADRSPLPQEAERLRALMQFAVDESRWSGASVVWLKTNEGYRFDRIAMNAANPLLNNKASFAVVEENGHSVTQDALLRPRQLPPEVTINTVELNGVIQEKEPRILFTAGIAPLFQITLARAEKTVTLVARANGSVDIVTSPP